jgi:hypothetical protein
MKRFEVGKTYQTRSLCDYNMKITFTVVDRTPKTIRMVEGFGDEPLKLNGDNRKVKTFRPATHGDVESVRPWGNYSLCPLLDANDLVQA